MKVKKNVMMFLFICLSGVICSENGSAEISQGHSLLISLEIDQQELKDVLWLISKQTGFTVKVDNKLISYRVTGKYHDVTVEQFFYRILREYNVSILVDENDKSIIVRSFGEKETSMYSVLYPADGGGEPLTGISLSEIKSIQAHEDELSRKHFENPDSIEPLTGISLSEIKSTQAHEDELSRKYFENPDSIEPLTGMTLRQIEAVRIREVEEVNEQNEVLEPLSGVSWSEMESIRAREDEFSRKYYGNPESIEPLTGMTLRQIEAVRINEERAVKGD